jgi:hypothetical protein
MVSIKGIEKKSSIGAGVCRMNVGSKLGFQTGEE